MDAQKVDMFLMTNGKQLPSEKIPFLRDQLMALDESKWATLSTLQFKDTMVTLIISLVLGCYGVDRFYIGDTKLGVLKLITCGGCGIWAMIDWFLIMGAAKEKNYAALEALIG